ncbi:peptide chain release factor N(5)-glutamine methyltransferase [Candidatus Pseudothioglobus singularis]|nr:peptide chain release factor N(5)-glutamine methyltransferase [Candidatus Pseudothioglobus singularis]
MKSIKDFLRNDVEDISKLLCLALNKTQEQLYANLDYQLVDTELSVLLSYIDQRKKGKPFAYIKGSKGFYDLDFIVSPATLIPRPETELLIDITLNLLDKNKNLKVLDLGTGSGVIAITISEKRPKWKLSATDLSLDALNIARLNSTKKIDFYCGSWFDPVPPETFDLIVSNPPYINEHDPHLQDLKYEPIEALVSGDDGLNDIREIITKSTLFLNSGGYLLLEHGYDQKDRIVKLLEESYTSIKTFKDLNKVDRAVLAKLR